MTTLWPILALVLIADVAPSTPILYPCTLVWVFKATDTCIMDQRKVDAYHAFMKDI